VGIFLIYLFGFWFFLGRGYEEMDHCPHQLPWYWMLVLWFMTAFFWPLAAGIEVYIRFERKDDARDPRDKIDV